MRHYLAYGSNLSIEQMTHRCPTATPIGTAVIPDYELLFRGSKTGSYLTIEPKECSYVPVLVWDISYEDKLRLDRYEGYPKFYYKEWFDIKVKPLNGGEPFQMTAFAYIMDDHNPLGAPSDWYYEVCREGYRRFGFDERLLETALERSVIHPKKRLEGFQEVRS